VVPFDCCGLVVCLSVFILSHHFPTGAHPLDNTRVHPNDYPLALKLSADALGWLLLCVCVVCFRCSICVLCFSLGLCFLASEPPCLLVALAHSNTQPHTNTERARTHEGYEDSIRDLMEDEEAVR